MHIHTHTLSILPRYRAINQVNVYRLDVRNNGPPFVELFSLFIRAFVARPLHANIFGTSERRRKRKKKNRDREKEMLKKER